MPSSRFILDAATDPTAPISVGEKCLVYSFEASSRDTPAVYATFRAERWRGMQNSVPIHIIHRTRAFHSARSGMRDPSRLTSCMFDRNISFCKSWVPPWPSESQSTVGGSCTGIVIRRPSLQVLSSRQRTMAVVNPVIEDSTYLYNGFQLGPFYLTKTSYQADLTATWMGECALAL